MYFVKNGDRYEAVNRDGETVAYIKRHYYGTHGHANGWEHYCMDWHKGRIVPAETFGFDVPWIFRNVKAFEDYYREE